MAEYFVLYRRKEGKKRRRGEGGGERRKKGEKGRRKKGGGRMIWAFDGVAKTEAISNHQFPHFFHRIVTANMPSLWFTYKYTSKSA